MHIIDRYLSIIKLEAYCHLLVKPKLSSGKYVPYLANLFNSLTNYLAQSPLAHIPSQKRTRLSLVHVGSTSSLDTLRHSGILRAIIQTLRFVVTDPELSFQQFEMDYENALAMLAERHGDDGAVDALIFAEESRPNSGADQYTPDWIQPFVAVVANLAEENFVRTAASSGGLASVIPQAIAPALVRAVQLGYVEGYFAAKDD